MMSPCVYDGARRQIFIDRPRDAELHLTMIVANSTNLARSGEQEWMEMRAHRPIALLFSRSLIWLPALRRPSRKDSPIARLTRDGFAPEFVRAAANSRNV
jgi:hypothetical protein